MLDPLETARDEELARRAQAGSESSFEQLVYRYEKRIFAFLRIRSGNAADAEDLTQRVFVKVYRSLQRFDPSRQFSPWVFTIARREAVGFYRARRPELTSEFDRGHVDNRDPATILSEKEEERGLWALARDELSLDQFTVLWLRAREDLSVRDVASVVGKTENHVKVLMYRARKRLTGKLAEPAREAGWREAVTACGEKRSVTPLRQMI